MDQRQQQLQIWLNEELSETVGELRPVVGDASFRRYFRFSLQGRSLIAMDSPPALEDPKPFVEIGQAYQRLGLRVPDVLAADLKQGFLVISDFGDQLYYEILSDENADLLYTSALDELPRIQQHQSNVPTFTETMLMTELRWFSEWFIGKFLGLQLNQQQKNQLDKTYQLLVESALEQPQVGVHRDYHSRNLMWLPEGTVGILDYQGAVLGPITYDAVSLLRDCYIDWPATQVEQWLSYLYNRLNAEPAMASVSFERFKRWFDLMGVQRHVKAIFIFARKALRDQNTLYLQFIPRALRYVQSVVSDYPELSDFSLLLKQVVLPAWERQCEQ